MRLRYDKEKEVFNIIESNRVEYHQTKLHLTRMVKNARYNDLVKRRLWNGEVSHFREGEFNLGLWKEVQQLCKNNGWKFDVENKEDFPVNRKITLEDVENFCKDFFKDHKLKNSDKPFIPNTHQIASVFAIMKARYCITEVATGGGKSLIFALICFYILKFIKKDAKILLIVPRISLVSQMYDDIINYNKGFNNENKNPLDIVMCEIMSEKPRRDEGEANIFIGTSQSLEGRDAEFFKQFNVVASDESHMASNSTQKGGIKQIEKILKQTFGHAYIRFGMSGTFPMEDTLDYLTIQSLHGPKIAEVKAKELMDKGIISTVKIKALMMNYGDSDFNDNLSIIRKGNGKAAFDLEKSYIHNSEARLRFMIDKIISKTDKNSLVLFNIIEYGKKIYNFLRDYLETHDVYYIDGQTKKDKREYIKKALDTSGRRNKIGKILDNPNIKDRPKILVASYGTLSTGVSINNLHFGIFAEGYKSEQIVIQSIGRLLRNHADKDGAVVFDMVDIFDDRTKNKNALYKHYLERKSFYIKREYPLTEIKINIR